MSSLAIILLMLAAVVCFGAYAAGQDLLYFAFGCLSFGAGILIALVDAG